MSNKVVNLTEEQKKQRETESYLQGRPNRLEVSNYVNSLLEEHYLPLITRQIQMSAMVLQGILIKKGITTGEEIEEITKEFIKQQQKELLENK